MIHLVYVSAACVAMEDAALKNLLETSRRNNPALGITGMLLYLDGLFMQVLEGEAAKVDALFARIQQDPRHAEVAVVLRESLAERNFPDWSMGFRNLSGWNDQNLPGFSMLMENGPSLEQLRVNPSVTLSLLLHFKAMNTH